MNTIRRTGWEICTWVHVHVDVQVEGGKRKKTNACVDRVMQGNTDGWRDQQKARLDGQGEFSNGVASR